MRRLAEGYGARYESFCLHALGSPRRDRRTRWFREPAPDVLPRLADGTGVPVAHLEQMTSAHGWARRFDERRQFAATPEGETEWARLLKLYRALQTRSPVAVENIAGPKTPC